MLTIENNLEYREKQIDFIGDVVSYNGHCYSKAYFSLKKNFDFPYEDQGPLEYFINFEDVLSDVLYNALRSEPYDFISLNKGDNHPVIADFLSIFGFEMKVKDIDGKMRFMILEKPEVFDFNKIPVLSASEWRKIIEKNHENYMTPKSEESEDSEDSEKSFEVSEILEKDSKKASTYVSYKE